MSRSKFLGRDVNRYKRLKNKWKRPKGRHNKMRLKRKGYPKTVSIGHGKAKGKKVFFIYNFKELMKVDKGEEVILKKMGRKMRLEIAKVAKEKGIKIKNLNIEKFLKQNEKKETISDQQSNRKTKSTQSLHLKPSELKSTQSLHLKKKSAENKSKEEKK